jgi:hypothetical protein
MSMSSSSSGSSSSKGSGSRNSNSSSGISSSGSGGPGTIPISNKLRNPMFDQHGLGFNFDPWFGTEGFLSRASLMIMAKQ